MKLRINAGLLQGKKNRRALVQNPILPHRFAFITKGLRVLETCMAVFN